jgi:plasmid stability protein
MPVTLSIKNVPDEVVERLRSRAKVNHRSLQGELMALIERVARETAARPLGVREVYDWARSQGFSRANESTGDIRRLRDERSTHVDKVLEDARARPRRTGSRHPRGRR